MKPLSHISAGSDAPVGDKALLSHGIIDELLDGHFYLQTQILGMKLHRKSIIEQYHSHEILIIIGDLIAANLAFAFNHDTISASEIFT